MTFLSRRTRLLTIPVALALAAGSLGALAAPASAAQTTFTQSSATLLGDTSLTASQGTDIHVPAIGDVGPADVYPSEINFQPSRTITDVNVTLGGVTSTAPSDLDVLLVGPGGQQALIMSDAGDGGDIAGASFTFSDQAGAAMTGATIVSGATYKPTNLNSGDADFFNAPAPAPTGNTALSVFNGTNAAGVWRLYVMDDLAADTHTISSWTLQFAFDTVPYPSTIDVSGLGVVTDVNVGLHGVTSTYLDDVDLLLVGPGGQQSTLMSDAGNGFDVTDLNLTVDDEAATPFPDETQIASGSYRPTDYEVGDTYPAPAPAASGSTALSVFDGLSPNGTWKLFAVDDAGEDLTQINSWTLEFTWTDSQSPSGTVNVNGGAATTTSKNVTLNLSATDPAPASGVKQMRFSNDGVTFSAYQPYAATAAWTLTGTDGTKTVYAQFRDGDGNQSAVTSDAITLDTLGPHSTKTTPKNKAKDVKRTTKVKIKANEALAGGSVSKKTVILKVKGGDTVKAKVSYNSAKMMIVITPKNDLKKHTTYKVKVKTSVKDLVGHGWDENGAASGTPALKFSFTTA